MARAESVRSRRLTTAAAGVVATLCWASPGYAYVQQIVIDSTNTAMYNPIPVGSSAPSGTAVSYTIYTGRVFGAVDPKNPLNALLTDIDHAAPIPGYSPPAGTVGYISNFQIVTPTDRAARSGLMIFEVPNRGGNTISTTALIQGATYVQSGWQGDLLTQCSGAPNTLPPTAYPCVSLANKAPGFGAGGGGFGTATTAAPFFTAPPGLSPFVMQVPVATTDGKAPNGSNAFTGPVYGQLNKGTTGPTGQMIMYETFYVPYQPATFDTSQVQFWSDLKQTTEGVDIGKTPIAGSQWEWAYCPNGKNGAGYIPNDPYWICLLNGGTFDPNKVYEMVFTAANPLVQGLGFAGVRDIVSFLRYGTSAPGGGANPIAGSITKTMSIGVSQDGAFIRGQIFWGFNQDESHRIVFDGEWPRVDGRMMWLNERFEQANVLDSVNMPADEAPVWYSDFPNQARGLRPDGIFHRCNATQPNSCPQVVETFGSLEFYAEKMGADFVGFCGGTSPVPCNTDIPLPPNDGSRNHVYRYFQPGTRHAGGAGGFDWAAPGSLPPLNGAAWNGPALYPADPIPETETLNALQADFIELLMKGTPMPPSFGGPGGTYPTLKSGQLALATNQAAVGFPTNIPGFQYGGDQAWPPFLYDFGPGINYDQQSGIISILPPITQGVLAAYVPTVNQDGNEDVGSVPSVNFAVPLGTYIGWNIYAPYNGCTGLCGWAGQQAQLNGSFWPFWDTQTNRIEAGDPRPSLEERYGTHNGYDCVVERTASKQVEARFLLPSDATMLIAQAAASATILPAPFVPTSADVALAHNILCGLTATHDFGGDYRSDILWRDRAGNLEISSINGAALATSKVAGTVPAGWAVVGQRDFNGDGNADILWRDSGGNVGIWLMNGTAVQQAMVIGNMPADWSVAATGDFNGDGKADIVWRDKSGAVSVWLMNGTAVAQAAVVGVMPTNWVIAGADNNGSIFWRNTSTGEVGTWLMKGTRIVQSANLGAMPLNWSVAGTGDFDGNGSTDILWRDQAGNVGIWLMDGTRIASSKVIGNVPRDWTIAETGDYAGTGKSDILWADMDGDVSAWFMDGSTVSSVTDYGNVGASMSVQGQGVD